MKKINLLAIIFVIAGFAGPVLASEQVPFKGSMAAVELQVVQGGSLLVDGSGAGNATQLGRFTLSYHVEVDLATGASVGTATFVAANGDTISTSIVGLGVPTPDPTVAMVEEVETITGGTGRFAGATGTFTLQRLVSLVTGVTSGSFAGTISK